MIEVLIAILGSRIFVVDVIATPSFGNAFLVKRYIVASHADTIATDADAIVAASTHVIIAYFVAAAQTLIEQLVEKISERCIVFAVHSRHHLGFSLAIRVK